ncbi:hypothetical protein [uncultured Erythrobacter sp.]|uniref:hypothetical protein n=1 Tax=uncultured Erythrobacter sp. TaxID=263913 RepID=UPI00262B1270|nr:hypothetical protein [uncultured Erythrobacter sp.]
MTIHFAAEPCMIGTPVSRALSALRIPEPANDNGDAHSVMLPDDQMLRAALRHFAEHGLGAARAARGRAEAAFFAGDRQTYEWWLGITRTLDRRLAAQAEQSKSALQLPLLAANESTSENA